MHGICVSQGANETDALCILIMLVTRMLISLSLRVLKASLSQV